MTPAAITNKLRLIAGLTAEECDGWPDGWKHEGREPFPGELAALAQRERESGVKR